MPGAWMEQAAREWQCVYLMRFTLSFREANRPDEEEEVRLGFKAGGAQPYRACNITHLTPHFTHSTHAQLATRGMTVVCSFTQHQ